jgi:hypothetical protein
MTVDSVFQAAAAPFWGANRSQVAVHAGKLMHNRIDPPTVDAGGAMMVCLRAY